MTKEIEKLQTKLRLIQQQFTEVQKAYEQLQVSFRQIETIYEFASSLNTLLELEDLLKTIELKFKNNYQLDAFALFLWNDTENKLIFKAGYNVTKNFIKSDLFNQKGSVFHKTIQTQKYTYLPNTAKKIEFSRNRGSLLCIPLSNEFNDILGLLCFFKNKEMSFNDSDLRFFNKIAEQIALTLDKVVRYEHYKVLSFTDELTGVYNRRYFMQRFDIEEQRSLRYKRPFAVFMLDIDHFKTYNDKNGHINGDNVLKKVAILLKSILRKTDIVARYGGEEFIILLPEISKEQAKVAAEKLRKKVANCDFRFTDNQLDGKLTISIGLSAYPDDTKKPGELIKLADRALYLAKSSGRNCVIVQGKYRKSKTTLINI